MKRREFLKAGGLGLAASAAVAAPAIAQSMPEVKWRLTSSFPKSLDTLWGASETFSKYCAEATDGKLQIQTFAAGEIVPGLQALDAVQAGTVEMCHTATYYSFGKDPTWALFCAVPFGLNCRQQNAWFTEGGGQKLMDEFSAKSNTYNLLMGNTGCQMGGWFNKEIKEPGDFNGIKMRIGAVPQALPGGDIYPALERGAIDATEWVGPYDDEKLGFYKIAKNYYYPGWWEPCSMYHVMINLAKWDTLPKQYQEAMISAARETNLDMVAEYDAKNRQALIRLKAAGVQFHKFSDDIMEGSYKAASGMYDEEAAKNPKFKKIYDEWKVFRAEEAAWFALSESAMDAFLSSKL